MQFLVLAGNVVGDVRANIVGEKQTPVVNFTLKVSEYAGKDENGKSKFLDRFYDCTMWNRDGLHPYVKRGKFLVVYGKVELPSVYTNGAGEVVASNVKVIVQDMTVAYDLSQGEHSSHELVQRFIDNGNVYENASQRVDDEDDDEIPF